jgi:raffinose/stachyose/melibiose transport system substrate-binding protein
MASISRAGLTRLAAAASITALALPAHASELVYWSMWNESEPQAEVMRLIMEAYTAQHPETTFKVVWNGRENQTKLRAALQAGTQVDLMDQDGDALVGGLQKQGLALQLDDILGPEFAKELLPGAYDIYGSDGKHYQMPYIYNTFNFWYNKDLMAEAGATPPATWDELLDVCAKVRAIGRDGLVIDNVEPYTLLYFSHLLDRKIGSNALMTIFEDKTGNGWLRPEVLEAAQMEIGLWDTCFSEDARGFQWPAGQQTVAFGDSMANLNGSWLPSELDASAGSDFPWGAFNFPAVEGGAGKASDMQVAIISMIALADTPNKEEAISFLRYLVSEESQRLFVERGNVGGTRVGVEWPAVLQDAYEASSNATALTAAFSGIGISYPEFFVTVLQPQHNNMFYGQLTPEAFIKMMADETRTFWASN